MSSAQDQPTSGAGTDATTTGTGMGATVGKHASPTAEATRGYVPRPAPGYDDQADFAAGEPSGAVIGWTLFAAVMLMISGIGNFLEGIAQIVNGSYFVTNSNYTYNLSVHTWGWFHLIAGIVVFLAGAALLMDKTWARWVGVAFASLSLFMNLVYLPFFPVWSIIVIAIDAFVIWALLAPRNGYGRYRG